MKNNILIAGIIALIIGAGGGFFAGMTFQKSQPVTNLRQFGNGQLGSRTGDQNRGRIGGGGRQTVGEVINQDDTSMTVKLPDGSTKIVLYSSKTIFNKAAEASISDIKVGTRVGVFGTENSDGSVTAQNIQLNPAFRGISGTPGPQQ